MKKLFKIAIYSSAIGIALCLALMLTCDFLVTHHAKGEGRGTGLYITYSLPLIKGESFLITPPLS